MPTINHMDKVYVAFCREITMGGAVVGLFWLSVHFWIHTGVAQLQFPGMYRKILISYITNTLLLREHLQRFRLIFSEYTSKNTGIQVTKSFVTYLTFLSEQQLRCFVYLHFVIFFTHRPVKHVHMKSQFKRSNKQTNKKSARG